MKASIVALCLSVVLAGCTGPSGGSRSAEVGPVVADQYEAAMQTGRDVLDQAGFTIDRDDERFGVLTSHPLQAPTLFEPWRGENTPSAGGAAATLAQIRRTARFTLQPDTDAGQSEASGLAFNPRFEVVVERQQHPLRRLDGSAQRVFAQLGEVPPEWQRRNIASGYWQPIERDAALERVLTSRFESQLRRR